jgi:hypothetical protein
LDNQLQAIFLILSELLEDDRYSRIYAGLYALILALDATTVLIFGFFLVNVLPATQFWVGSLLIHILSALG